MSRRFLSKAGQAGFTLLELLVVLSLAAMAATLVGGGAQSFMERSRYHQTVRDVATQLGRARALCVQEGRTVVVAYDPQVRQLIVDGQRRLNIPPSLQVNWEPLRLQRNEQAGPHQTVFIFNADGGASGGRFAVSRDGGQGVAFQVNWLLGTVEQAAAVAS
ncbi:prepilin-type N-terminal cleavage/methylation domain-containing protein [Acidovorax sp. MR-S7]|uniref:GspH/FimT family pseudopilin n=1 Tax=Acidovorax sp. MR-S7 TaxID=1268622 RepID=UPI0003D3D67F|nr:prepilin-type N-terminal cleavage/methylation domain-containing protein [Acidovorax sp. MR-S7]GAD20287.1 general secretion pathway protein H [Acidovorax sp. MR-S7]